MRRLALPLVAVLLVGAVLGVEVAASGGHYVPRPPANPCVRRPILPIQPRLEPLAEQIVLLGLDNAACRLGISRERLVLALADTRSLDPRAPGALKAGLREALDRPKPRGPPPNASPPLSPALNPPRLPRILTTLVGRVPG